MTLVRIVIAVILAAALVLYISYPSSHEYLSPPPRTATDKDFEKAFEYALSHVCTDKGFTAGPDGTCMLNEATCKNGKNGLPGYVRWTDGKCMLGNEPYRQFCKGKGLRFDEAKGTCKTTQSYCSNKQVSWRGGDCHLPGEQRAAEFIFGKTVTRTATKVVDGVGGFFKDLFS
jgi:hypothetical protein